MAACLGAFLGVLNARYLFVGSWMSLVLWTFVGLILGYWSKTWHPAVVGAAYGFMLSFVFMSAGYAGKAPLVSRLLPFVRWEHSGGSAVLS